MAYSRSQLEAWYKEGSADFRARRPETTTVKIPDRVPKGMNKTERRWLDRMAIQKRMGTIRNYRYTGHRRHLFKLADKRWYNPDFFIKTASGDTEVIECKGGYIWPDSVLKFDIAASQYPEYVFRMLQWKGGEWTEVRTRNNHGKT